MFNCPKVFQVRNDVNQTPVWNVALFQNKCLQFFHLNQFCRKVLASLRSHIILGQVEHQQVGHVSFETINQRAGVSGPERVIYENDRSHGVRISFYRFANGLQRGRRVQELIYVLNDGRLSIFNDLTRTWVDMHVFALLKVGEARVGLGQLSTVFKLPVWFVEFPELCLSRIAD